MKTTYEWYDVDVEFEVETEDAKGNPKEKTVTEKYLVNALSPTEAETKFNKFAEEKEFQNFRVKKAVERKYIDVIGR